MKFIAVVCVVVFALLGVAFGYRNPVCSLPPAVSGNCFASINSYSYHADTNTCKPFISGGCGGNANSFETFEECQAKCTLFLTVPIPIYRYTIG